MPFLQLLVSIVTYIGRNLTIATDHRQDQVWQLAFEPDLLQVPGGSSRYCSFVVVWTYRAQGGCPRSLSFVLVLADADLINL